MFGFNHSPAVAAKKKRRKKYLYLLIEIIRKKKPKEKEFIMESSVDDSLSTESGSNILRVCF